MKSRFLKLGGAAAGLAAIGVATVYVAAPGGGEQEVVFEAETATPIAAQEEVASQAGTLQACVPPGLPSPAPTPVKGVPFPNPEAGLSDAERMALYQRLREEGQALSMAWLECLDISKLDLRSLPRYFNPGLHVDFDLTLPGAVARADLIVVGNVTGVSATPSHGVVQATLSVERTLKGASESTVVVSQGFIQPTQDWSSATLVEDMFAEMLFPGDRAVLLLHKSEDQYWVEGESGWFQVVDGRVTPNPFNDWGASVDGMPEAQLIELLTAAAKTGPTTP